ncbi:MAG: ABC transporter permease subunit [Limisphaerales bacterium]
MTVLPIVERELRVASRKPSTFWLRVAAALVALVIGSGFFCLTLVPRVGFGAVNLGKGLFGVLTWISLAAALLAGLFFTSDCLSEEKREGTLGFLFLTDLRGYDVVLGKMLATSLRGAYALLASFPILAVTLMMGGVSGVEFWKTMLALVNALFVSLAAGLFVSAISRDAQKALAGTLLLLLLLVGGGPAIDATFAAGKTQVFNPVLSVSSPGYLFVAASLWGQTMFWPVLLVNQVIGWSLLGAACQRLPRTWREKPAKTSAARGNWAYARRFGGAEHRRALRRKLIDPNPILWLACRERCQSDAFWGLTILLVGAFVATFAGSQRSTTWFAWNSFGGLLTLVLYLGIASQAGRFFVEAQRSGLIELLLATPLTVSQIVEGQWRGWLRLFAAPLTLCLAAQLLGSLLVQQMTWSSVAAAVPPAPMVTMTNATRTTNAPNKTINVTHTTVVATSTVGGPRVGFVAGGFRAPEDLGTLAVSFAATLTVAANLAALGWFGMWMGLTSRTANSATLKTIVFVQVIPWFVIGFASAILLQLLLLPAMLRGGSGGPSRNFMFYPLLQSALVTVLSLAKDLGFALWARRKLHSEFRERAVRAVAPIRFAPPPPLPRPGTPPVIAPTH